ncbi:hypothetical protein PoB_002953600, partial [Plakobranchus ocellatus]
AILTLLLCFARVSKAAGDELCEQPDKFLRLATCFRVVSGLSSSRDLYNHVASEIQSSDATTTTMSKTTTAATTTASTTAELKHLSIIRSEAKYVSGNLKELLTLWRHRCDACGYF